MDNLSGHTDETLKTLDGPDSPYEHKVCNLMMFGVVAFLLASGYFFLLPGAPLRGTVMVIGGGFFALTLLNFFIAAFRGKLCGCSGRQN